MNDTQYIVANISLHVILQIIDDICTSAACENILAHIVVSIYPNL